MYKFNWKISSALEKEIKSFCFDKLWANLKFYFYFGGSFSECPNGPVGHIARWSVLRVQVQSAFWLADLVLEVNSYDSFYDRAT